MIEIKQLNDPQNGIFEIFVDGAKAGEMVYRWKSDFVLVIEHTEVHENFNGKGLGKRLVLAAVDFARVNNYQIIPLCPFAKATFQRNEDLQDVLA